MSYGNDALMPDQAYSSAPMDTGLDGLGFVHPESFNQANTENHGRTRSHKDVTFSHALRSEVRSSKLVFPPVEPVDARPIPDRGLPTRPGKGLGVNNT